MITLVALAAAFTTKATTITTATVDFTQWSGYENAIYAPNDSTVIVGYKRFLTNPAAPGIIPADMRIARSTDNGATWAVTVVDTSAPEEADRLDRSISIDGDHGQNVFVSYFTQATNDLFTVQLHSVKSTDGGATWSAPITVALNNVGDQNSTRVIDANNVFISAHGNGTGYDGVHVFSSTDGGSTWVDTYMPQLGGSGFYTSVAGSMGALWVSWYDGSNSDSALNGSRQLNDGSWVSPFLIDGSISDTKVTGLGNSMVVTSNGMKICSYEEDTPPTTTAVKVAAKGSPNGSWSIRTVQSVPTDISIGENTSIHEYAGVLYLSYYRVPSNGRSIIVFATSSDNGQSWVLNTIPEVNKVFLYNSNTAPSNLNQYVSYMSFPFTQPVFKVAHVTP